MSLERVVNALKMHAEAIDASIARPSFGIVESYNPSLHAVKVLIQPDGVLSGWVPIASQMTGPGWGVAVPPVPGQQVLLNHQGGDSSAPVVVGSVYSDNALPPVANSGFMGNATHVSTGEVLMVNQAGATIRLCADGSAYLQGTAINIAGPVNITGNLTVNGGIVATADIAAGSASVTLLSHVHGDVQAGSAYTTQATENAGTAGGTTA